MKNTIIAWHAQQDGNHFPRQSRAINDCYELWESCRFDEVVEKLSKGRVPILMVAADQQGQEIMARLSQLGESYPELQVIALFNNQCNTQTLEKLCHMLCGTQEKPSPTADTLISALTRRQQQVLDLISRGHSNKQIADKLHMSEGTVKIHCMAIFRGLGVNNRTQAAMLATGAI
ncbi:MAG: response regulator transcription factor [Arenicella sp.]